MHFLNLAVQPRWDSPQDMFGFYNYLENRYRATELSRALVQMDGFYDEKGRGWNFPKDWKLDAEAHYFYYGTWDNKKKVRVTEVKEKKKLRGLKKLA